MVYSAQSVGATAMLMIEWPLIQCLSELCRWDRYIKSNAYLVIGVGILAASAGGRDLNSAGVMVE